MTVSTGEHKSPPVSEHESKQVLNDTQLEAFRTFMFTTKADLFCGVMMLLYKSQNVNTLQMCCFIKKSHLEVKTIDNTEVFQCMKTRWSQMGVVQEITIKQTFSSPALIRKLLNHCFITQRTRTIFFGLPKVACKLNYYTWPKNPTFQNLGCLVIFLYLQHKSGWNKNTT